MPQMSNFIKKLENYADLEVSIIRQTKINKVLKALIKLNTIPRDEEFQFRKRSLELLTRWNKILGAEPPDAADIGGDKEAKDSPATNGIHDEKTEEPSNEKQEDAPAPAEQPAAEAEVEKTTDASAAAGEPENPTVEEPKPAPVEESAAKPETSGPEVLDKAPESAEAATEATDIVKAAD